jgi:parallel beta-helix repeat protein
VIDNLISGNELSGIDIRDDASYNVVGPNNVISYNSENGIQIAGPNSLRNTITQNSIHDNNGVGIYLQDGGNTDLAAPFITDFDLGVGTVTGTACADCTVEIFSDSSVEGEVYEGRTTVNDFGFFTFNKGAPLTGPRLTATATDADGNTSEFSAPRRLGTVIVVTNTADSGPGTLRQSLLDAQSDDTITFDTAVFPPTSPMTISLTSGLPDINQGNLTIDASNAGVILDGRNITGDWVNGLDIYSDGNIVRGLQIINFPGVGIDICGGSHNRIGGDRRIGTGPLGQGNLVSKNKLGINLCGYGTSFNTITGNLIGTDPTGTYELEWINTGGIWIKNEWGNKYDGIWIGDGPSQNTIGPNNIIAFNRYNGIKIIGINAVGNTIIQNSIRDNGGLGIYLWSGGNTELTAPSISDLDLRAGTVTGTACANCIVEIFSDNNSEGEILEGQTTADGTGFFAFNKGTPFTGPLLTATATDANGNTSQFSRPKGIVTILQEGNNQPKIPIQPRSSGELTDNRIGSQWHSLYFVVDPEEMLDENLALGVKRFRLSINNTDSSNVDLFWSRSEFSIEPEYDDFISRLANNGVRVTYVLSFWDKAYQDAGGVLTFPRFQTEDQIQRYLDYVRFIVRHFKDRVQYFELWNEPSFRDTMQWIKVEDYINLIRRTVPVIHQEHPEAKIVVGGTHFLMESDSRDYLFTILRSEIMPLVDVVAWHPMYGTSPEYDFHRQYYYEYPSLVQEIKDVASAHGFRGEFVADDLLWRTPENDNPETNSWPHASDEIKAAKYMARGIMINLGMDVSVTQQDMGNYRRPPLIFDTVQNLCTIMAGNKPISLPVTIQSEATNIKTYGFSLPNGDHLIALWTDGVAVDDDPGVDATLTIPGFADQTAVGIDVLHGFEQRMITDTEGENLVIHNLLVKDYPIILRLARTRYVFLPIVLKGYTR